MHIAVLTIVLLLVPTIFSWTQPCQTRLTTEGCQEEFSKQTRYFTFCLAGQAS